MWIAFAIAAILIGYSVTYAQRLLALQQDELQQALVMRERNQRLTALATLAAGAAHELATPLSTIAVVAKELEHKLRTFSGQENMVKDASILCQQVRRCRTVLEQLTVQITDDDRINRASIGDVVAWALHDMERANDVRVEISQSLEGRSLLWPPRAVSASLRNVIQNALEASPGGKAVSVRAHDTNRGVVLEIRDDGIGMGPSVLRRATEPFFSTKRAGNGMGLGLFLAQGLMDQLGGNLELDSEPGQGTTVRFTFPIAEVGYDTGT
jgi:two-component system sensor histidine kinase RegB